MDKIFSRLSISNEYKTLVEPYWLDSLNYKHDVDFLDSEFIKKYSSIALDDEELCGQLSHAAELIKNNSTLTRLIEHARYRLCFSADSDFHSWPDFEAALGDNSGMFYLLAGISAVPEIFNTFKGLGIPESMAADCAKWLNGCVGIYRSSHNGKPGMCKRQLHWIRNYINGILFRIGRFEFMNQDLPKNYKLNIWRSCVNSNTVAFLDDGTRIDKDGYLMYEDDDLERFAFESRLKINGKTLIGNSCLPTGTVSSEELTLNLDEWEAVTYEGCFTPGVHIPGGGRMTLAVCRESFQKAAEFYKRYFPEKKVTAFVCASWIFYPEFEKRLPDSNLAVLMRELYLFPFSAPGCRHGVFFLFGRDDGDLQDYPRDNSARRAMLDIAAGDKPLRCGGMFILAQDISRFGEQFYRNEACRPVGC